MVEQADLCLQQALKLLCGARGVPAAPTAAALVLLHLTNLDEGQALAPCLQQVVPVDRKALSHEGKQQQQTEEEALRS